jgi:hypothetical protein
MALPLFAIGEWLVCSSCGIICDAPFLPPDSDATEPELVLGSALPESEVVPAGDWSVEVEARCPGCGARLRALAAFEGRTLRRFTQAAEA